MPSIIISKNSHLFNVLPFEGTLFIGRGEGNDAVLNEAGISRKHARIELINGEYFLMDQGSTNGTFVEDQRIHRYPLAHGSSFRIHNYLFTFVSDIRTETQPSLEMTTIAKKDDFARFEEKPTPPGKRAGQDEELGMKLSHLLKMVTGLISAPADADTGALALSSLYDICNAKRGMIAKLDGSDGLVAFCAEGFDPFDDIPQQVHALMQRVVAKGAPFTVGKTGAHRLAQSHERGTESMALCIPLVDENQTIGCLYLERPQRSSGFSKTDLDLVATASDYISEVLLSDKPQTNGLNREEKRYARELEKEGIIARSPKTLRVFQDSRKISHFHVAVLIYGETGSGKEVIARYIHDRSGRTGAFIPCNCSAIAASMFESELFGHEKGAFTGAVAKKPGLLELADGGTLFLDEIGDMPVEQQSKLLRALQEQEVWRVGGQSAVKIDVRVISATHKDIKNRRKELNFRDDLYYRLANVEITAPSLKKRIEDIGPLSHLILQDLGQRHLKKENDFSISPKAVRLLEAYDWPGNIRELRNTLFQAAYRCEGNSIERHHLKNLLDVFEASPQTDGGTISPMVEVEREHLTMALEYTNWNKSAAAKALKMDRNRLSRRLKKLGIKKAGK